ncbi:hypothetical protein PCI56_06490 [Plesiomonas shigelloides subsp. oncorhynchi]|nr:hypothetical protein [Plesiomonas shigelloides]
MYHGICADFSNEQHWKDATIAKADIYLSSALISKSGLQQDFELLSERAKMNSLNVVLANSVGVTGGWNAAGGSGVWNSDGYHTLSASDNECIVLCRISNSGVSGEVINITKLSRDILKWAFAARILSHFKPLRMQACYAMPR